jgi:hypothetical protein
MYPLILKIFPEAPYHKPHIEAKAFVERMTVANHFERRIAVSDRPSNLQTGTNRFFSARIFAKIR